MVRPNYSAMARRIRLENDVTSKIVVDAEGNVTKVKIIQNGWAGFDEETLKTVRRSHLRILFQPITRLGLVSSMFLFAAAVSFFSPALAHAGRPLVIDDASPVASGNLEIELGFSHPRPRGGGKQQSSPVAMMAYGLTDRMEVGLSIQRINQDLRSESRVQGFEDLHLTTKILAIAEGQALPAVSLNLDIKLPTADRDKGLSTGRSDQDLMLILTRSFAPLAAHLNFAYRIVDSPRGAKLKNVFHGGMAVDWSVRPHWAVVGEVFGSSREAKGEINDAAFQLGLRYTVIPGLVLDGAVGRSFRYAGTQIQGTVGLTWTWDILNAIKARP